MQIENGLQNRAEKNMRENWKEVEIKFESSRKPHRKFLWGFYVFWGNIVEIIEYVAQGNLNIEKTSKS